MPYPVVIPVRRFETVDPWRYGIRAGRLASPLPSCKLRAMFRCLCLLSIGAALLRCADATMDPAAWHKAALPNVEAGANEFHFWPDTSNPLSGPRVMIGGAGGNWRTATGGPPAWVGNSIEPLNLTGQGYFLPGILSNYLFSPAGGAGARHLQVARFQAGFFPGHSGTAFPEPVDSRPSTEVDAIHANFDPAVLTRLHVSYARRVGNVQYLCYARLTSSGEWQVAERPMPAGTVVLSTVVVAANFDSPHVYYSLTDGANTALYRISLSYVTQPGTGISVFQWHSNTLYVGALYPDSKISFLRTPNNPSNGRIFYSRFVSNVTMIGMIDLQAGGSTILWTEPNPNVTQRLMPRSIIGAFGQNGQIRVAWYEARHGNIHYLRPDGTAAGTPTVPGTPVNLGASLPNADLRGFHFDPYSGRPYLLYRRSLTEGGIAFLKDDFDFNGNGRPDFWDMALGNDGRLGTFPVAAAIPGVPGSANQFKVTFPAVSTVNASVTNAALTSSAANIRYRLAVSTDLKQWTIKTSDVVFTSLGPTAPGSQHMTIVARFTDESPSSVPTRFARLVFDRPDGGY